MGDGAGPDHGFGWLVRRYRRAAGLTQEELAERAGLSVRTVSDMERGRTTKPFVRSARMLADALELAEPARVQLMGALHDPPEEAALPERASDLDSRRPRPVVPRLLPAPVRHFAGRAAELRTLNDVLGQTATGSGAVVILAIGGTAGVGKTALAVHWAHQVAAHFPDGQLYINLRGFDPSRTPVTPPDAIRRFLAALEVPVDRIPPSTEAQEDLYRTMLADRRLLIILDNARDAEQVRPLLPGGPQSLVVVTSRSQLAGLASAEGAHQVCLQVLTHSDAHDLLALRLGIQRLAAEPAAASRLIELCAHLPLALSIAAARAGAHAAFPLAALAAELQLAGDALDILDGGDAASSVRAVFSWSCTNLSQPAARMFRLLSVHPGPDISVAASASLAGLQPQRARRLLGDLAGASLLTEQAPGRFAFHDLLRAYAAEQAHALDSGAVRKKAMRRVLDYYLHTARAADKLLYPTRRQINVANPQPGVRPDDLPNGVLALAWFDAEHRVLLAAIGLAADSGLSIHAWQLAWMLETFFFRRGHWHDWAATQHIALTAAKRLGDPYAQAQASRGVASAQIELGRYDDALCHLDRALRLHQEAGRLEGQARVHMDIGRVRELQGRYRQALAHGRQGLSLSQAAGDQALVTQADALNQIGWYLAKLGRYEEALGPCQQALALHFQLGDTHSEPTTLDSLAYAHHHLGHHAEAAVYYRRAVELFAELECAYLQAQTLAYAGDAHHDDGDTPAAHDAWTQALAIFDDLHHPAAGDVRAKLEKLDLTAGA